MAKPRIIIADTDVNYIIPLQLKFVEEYFNKVDIEIITDPDFFSSLFFQPQEADILVVSEQLYDSSLQRHNIKSVFLMEEQHEEESTGDLNVTRIFKYTSIKEIFNEIIGKSPLSIDDYQKTTQVIYVCSASGGTGKTALAMAISTCLTKNYKKVLYINASHMQSFQRMLKNASAITSSDVYSKLIAGGNDVYADIKHVIRSEGFSYLPPFKAALISLGIKFSIFEKIIMSAKKSNDYDFIVVDSDAPFDENNVQLLNSSDRIIVVTGQSYASVFATNVLVSNINGVSSDKYLFVCNDFDNESDNALISPNIKVKFTISEYVEHIMHFDQLSIEDLANNRGIQKVAYLVL